MEVSLKGAAGTGFANPLQLKVFTAMMVGVSIGTFTLALLLFLDAYVDGREKLLTSLVTGEASYAAISG